MTWDKPFDDQVEGSYHRTYTCCDMSGKCSSVTREFIVVDQEKPTITVNDPEPEKNIFEAQHNVDYADPGANCQDYVDGALANQVVASGQLVKMAVPGIYTIEYNCDDLSGNSAPTAFRVVKVQDTICPQIKVNGAMINYIESGFPFEDDLPAGFATAWDTLDGDLTHKVQTDGDSVTTASTFFQKSSCQEIKKTYPQAKTSEYYISRQVKLGHFERVLVWCNFGASVPATKSTYYYVSGAALEHRVSNAYTGNTDTNKKSECPDHGLKLLQLPANTGDYASEQWYLDLDARYPNAFTDLDAERGDYVCVDNDWGVDITDTSHSDHKRFAESKTGAQIGKYVITYFVEDAAGNRNDCDTMQTGQCDWTINGVPITGDEYFNSEEQLKLCDSNNKRRCNTKSYTANKLCVAAGGKPSKDFACLDCDATNAKRTVIVKDDLPPVISLAQRTASATLMAQGTPASGNAWFAGAAVAALAGVAMLGMSRRKQVATISVPV